MRRIKSTMRHLGSVALLISLTSLGLNGEYIVVDEDFTDPPNQLDATVWSVSSFGGGSTRLVSGGQLRLRSQGWAHFNNITLNDAGLNFFEREHTVSVSLEGLAEPNWEIEPLVEQASSRDGYNLAFHRRELYFVMGPASNWNEYVDWDEKYYQWEGFGFSIRWELVSEDPRVGAIFLRSDNPDTGIDKWELSAFPTNLNFTVNGSGFLIELEGAEFVSTGANVMTGDHTLDNSAWDDRYYFMTVLHQYAMDTGYFSEVNLKSVLITAESPPPGPVLWAGFDILEDSWVDTREMLGMLYIGLSPWVFSENMQRWIYLPEDYVTEEGAWWSGYR